MNLRDAANQVYDLASEYGWDSRVEGASESTVSLYIELSREKAIPPAEDSDESYFDYIHVRISDHGKSHARPDGEKITHIRLDSDAEADIETLRVLLA